MVAQLAVIQEEARRWRRANFGDPLSYQQLLGMGEELGEAFHAYLKREQGIRGNSDEHTAALRDSVGDLVIFAMGLCDAEGWNLEEVVSDTWNVVKQRNWVANKDNGSELPREMEIEILDEIADEISERQQELLRAPVRSEYDVPGENIGS